MEREIKGRKWQLTINNPQQKNYTHEVIKSKLSELKSIIYYCMSDEVARTHHTHIYLLVASPIRFSTLKKKFPEAHIEKAYGNSQENREYIYKAGKWVNDQKKETNLSDTHEEWGDIPVERQGARNDLAELYELISEGRSIYEILEEKPEFINQIERMDKVRQIIQEENYKNVFRKLFIEYVYGDTGAGKTRGIMEKYGYENVFRITNYKNPFDQYKGQDVICFDEFQSSVPIIQMLVYLDGYPCILPSRYSDKVACYTKVYILSNIALEEQYKEIQKYNYETWKAFLRRINSVRVYQHNEVKAYTIEEYLNLFPKITEYETIACLYKGR